MVRYRLFRDVVEGKRPIFNLGGNGFHGIGYFHAGTVIERQNESAGEIFRRFTLYFVEADAALFRQC